MSEYQYYEFQALDRRLTEDDRKALRAISTRARITATSFTNDYQWGDLKGDPAMFMDRWFDLHLYFANWGTHRLMIRVPERSIDLGAVDAITRDSDDVTVRRSGGHVIFDICRDELDQGDDFWGSEDDDDSRWLADMEPLRADLIAGDLRLFYLLWLVSVERGAESDDAMEPLPGIGPLSDALATFARFFAIDTDLVAAAAERSPATATSPASPKAIRQAVTALSETERLDVLVRLATGDPQAAADFERAVRRRLPPHRSADAPPPALRTAGELRGRAREIRKGRERAAAEREAARMQKQREDEAKARRAALDALLRRGDNVWREIEVEIERRNASGYDRALDLLTALQTLAHERATTRDFDNRLASIRERHSRKERLMERLATLE